MTARKRDLPRGIRRHVRDGGRVVYEVRVTDAGGSEHSRTFADLAAATEWQAEYQAGRRRGARGNLTGERALFGTYARAWMQSRSDDTARFRRSTIARDVSYLGVHVIPALGAMRLADIERRHITALTTDLSTRLAPATTNKILTLITAILDSAVDDGHISRNVAAKAPRVAQDDDEARFLTHGELDRLEAAMHPWWRLVVPVLAETGLRIGELASLTVADVTVDVQGEGKERTVGLADVADADEILGGTVRVRYTTVELPKAVTGADTQRTKNRTKTRAGRRTVPTLTATTCRRLVEQVRERKQEPSGDLFTGQRGAGLSPRLWRARVWKPAVKAAGLAEPLPTPHALRHTAVSLWIEAGVTDTTRLAAYAGHRSTATLIRIYGHLLPHDASDLRRALDRRRGDQ